MTRTFVLRISRLEVAGVIGGVENDGILVYAEALKGVHDSAESLVQALDHAQIASEVLS